MGLTPPLHALPPQITLWFFLWICCILTKDIRRLQIGTCLSGFKPLCDLILFFSSIHISFSSPGPVVYLGWFSHCLTKKQAPICLPSLRCCPWPELHLLYSYLSFALYFHWSRFLPKYFRRLWDIAHPISSISFPAFSDHLSPCSSALTMNSTTRRVYAVQNYGNHIFCLFYLH